MKTNTKGYCVFQHTAARRRLAHYVGLIIRSDTVSTHSRPKAAGIKKHLAFTNQQFQHTAARRRLGCLIADGQNHQKFQHTAARRRLDMAMGNTPTFKLFQHTAARRRLDTYPQWKFSLSFVSTHSRPKAAGAVDFTAAVIKRFNTQPPEGGWAFQATMPCRRLVSTHSRPKAAGIPQIKSD